MTAKQYQTRVFKKLKKRFSTLEIESEWTSFKNKPFQYSPRMDIAVGPFSIIRGKSKAEEYDRLLDNKRIQGFLKLLHNKHTQNIEQFRATFQEDIPVSITNFHQLHYQNENSRCLFAIEIENTNSKKHIMGSMVNACSLGRIGIGIAFKPDVLRTFIRILGYLEFLHNVDKTTYDAANFLVLSKEQFEEVLNQKFELSPLDYLK